MNQKQFFVISRKTMATALFLVLIGALPILCSALYLVAQAVVLVFEAISNLAFVGYLLYQHGDCYVQLSLLLLLFVFLWTVGVHLYRFTEKHIPAFLFAVAS